MALPPPSIILLIALFSLDVVLTLPVMFAASFYGFRESDMGADRYAPLFALAAVLVVIHLTVKIGSLIGLFWARRWAVVLGTVGFAVSWPLMLYLRAPLELTAVLTIALFLACTLPHWERMTWKFP